MASTQTVKLVLFKPSEHRSNIDQTQIQDSLQKVPSQTRHKSKIDLTLQHNDIILINIDQENQHRSHTYTPQTEQSPTIPDIDSIQMQSPQHRSNIGSKSQHGPKKHFQVTNDKLIFENHIRAGQEKIGSAVVGEQIQIRISCSYNLTIQLKETYKISQE